VLEDGRILVSFFLWIHCRLQMVFNFYLQRECYLMHTERSTVWSMEVGMTEIDSAGAKAQTHLRHRNQVEGYNLPFEVPRRTAGVGK
jgi:hypothetical protein